MNETVGLKITPYDFFGEHGLDEETYEFRKNMELRASKSVSNVNNRKQ